MEDRETARMRKYGESKMTRIMMATVPHVTSGLGLISINIVFIFTIPSLIVPLQPTLFSFTSLSHLHFSLYERKFQADAFLLTRVYVDFLEHPYFRQTR